MQQSLEQKQQYLRQNIIEAGYDPEKFVQFCSQSHDLSDLQNWAMKQLTSMVSNFVQMSPKQPQISQQSSSQKGADQIQHNHQQIVTNKPQKKTTIEDNLKLIANPVPQNKLGVVFSDTDWQMLLSAPAFGNEKVQENKIIQSKKQENNIFPEIDTTGTQMKRSEKTVEAKEPQKKYQKRNDQEDQKQRQSPLSPPSTNLQGNDKSMKSLPDSTSHKSKKSISNNPINLSNIKITTTKEMKLPELPTITDIKITKTEQVSRNFLQSDYTLYHIQFNPCKHVVQRKFNDFRKLRLILAKLFPFLRLPYLEPEGWLNSSQGKDHDSLSKYKAMIEQFMKFIIMRSEELRNCNIVRVFCGFSVKSQKKEVKKEDMKKLLEQYDSMAKPKYIGQLILTDNTISIPPTTNGERVISNTINVLTELDSHYEKLRKQLDSLFYTYDLLIKNLCDVSSTFETMQNLIKKYNFDNDTSKEFKLFDGLKDLTNKMGCTINDQYGIFKLRIKDLFKYEKENMQTIKEVINNRNKIHYDYVKLGQPTMSSTSSFKMVGADIEVEGNIMIDEPLRNNKHVLAVQEVFWSHMTIREINRYWQELRRKLNEMLSYISYDELDRENVNLNFWNHMIKSCII